MSEYVAKHSKNPIFILNGVFSTYIAICVRRCTETFTPFLFLHCFSFQRNLIVSIRIITNKI